MKQTIPPREGNECGFSLLAARHLRKNGETLPDALQRLAVYEALQRSNFVQTKAARLLGVTPVRLCQWCKRYGWKVSKGLADVVEIKSRPAS